MRALFIPMLLAVCAATTLQAQPERATGLKPGTRVRVAAPVRKDGLVVTATRGWTIGTIQSIDRESVVLRVQRPEGEMEEQIPFDIITDLEVSRGMGSERGAQRRGAVRGGIIGATMGAAASAFAYLYDRGVDDQTELEDCPGGCTIYGASPGTAAANVAIGAGVGVLVGSVLGGRAREIWEPTREPRVDFGASATGRTTLSLSFAF